MNMKWKLTFRYVLSIAIVAVLVVALNIVALMSVMIFRAYNYREADMTMDNAEYYVREFKNYIHIKNNNTFVNKEGKEYLEKNNLWVQILDEDNREVYSYKKPEDVKDKHTPIDLINGYKYSSGFGGDSDILVGSKIIDNKTYTYIVGFPMEYLEKFIVISERDKMLLSVKKAMSAMIIMDIIIAIIFGYMFSIGLTKPVKKIINGVEDLSSGDYNVYYKEKGIYSNVFSKLNFLSYKLNDSEIERKKIEKMREDWIANISHDIKTPLSSIKGYAEILGYDCDFSKEEIKEYSEIINDKSDYITELVNDLNLTMKLKNNNSILEKEETNIVNLVKNSVIDIFNDPKYSERNIEFINDKENIIRNVDKILMKRVINNIIYNALVHNDENVSITVKVFEKDDKVHIIISDNGVGINEEELKYIFDRYYRGTNTGEAHKGSGLGMAIAKEVINGHNGEIKISSSMGKGTNIEIIV